MRIDYANMTVTTNGEPSDEALKNCCNIFIDYLIDKYGSDNVRIGLQNFIDEHEKQ